LSNIFDLSIARYNIPPKPVRQSGWIVAHNRMKFWQCLRLFKEDEYDLKESDMIGQSKVGKCLSKDD